MIRDAAAANEAPVKWLLPLVLVLLAAPERPAAACTQPPPYFSTRDVRPTDRATGVPINARIAMLYSGGGAQPSPPILRTTSGVEVPLDVTVTQGYGMLVVTAVPREPLAPMTSYQLLDRVDLGCSGGAGCELVDPTAFAVFTTGIDADQTSPVAAAVPPTVTEGALESCDDGSCCGIYTGRRTMIGFPAVTDEGGTGFYELVGVDAVLSFVMVSPGGVFHATHVCGFYQSRLEFPPLRSGRYLIRAHDLAGNQVDGMTFAIDGACSEQGPLGCGCRLAGHSRPTAAAVFVVLAMMIRRRRRPPATGR